MNIKVTFIIYAHYSAFIPLIFNVTQFHHIISILNFSYMVPQNPFRKHFPLLLTVSSAVQMLQQQYRKNFHKQQPAKQIHTSVIHHSVFDGLTAQQIIHTQNDIHRTDKNKCHHHPAPVLI